MQMGVGRQQSTRGGCCSCNLLDGLKIQFDEAHYVGGGILCAGRKPEVKGCRNMERSEEHNARLQTDEEMLFTKGTRQVAAVLEEALSHCDEIALPATSVAERQDEHACMLQRRQQSEEIAESIERHEKVIAKSVEDVF